MSPGAACMGRGLFCPRCLPHVLHLLQQASHPDDLPVIDLQFKGLQKNAQGSLDVISSQARPLWQSAELGGG
jgi:hypothetical protein